MNDYKATIEYLILQGYFVVIFSNEDLNLNLENVYVLNTEEMAQKARSVGAGVSETAKKSIETIVREKPKIGRNEKVTIKNINTGETKVLKFKQAEILIKKGEWVISS